MTTVLILIGAFLILLGILIKHARMYNLISGYSSMPSEKRIKFDINGFSTLLRNCLVLIGLFFIVGHLFFKWIGWETASGLVVLISVPVLIYLLAIGQSYNGDYPVEKAMKNKKILLSIYGILFIILTVWAIYSYISI